MRTRGLQRVQQTLRAGGSYTGPERQPTVSKPGGSIATYIVKARAEPLRGGLSS